MIETKQETTEPVIGAGLAEELAKILGVDPDTLRPNRG